MDFERPYLRPQPGAAAGANGTGAGNDEQHEHGSNPLSAFGAPGNLGERSAAFPGVDLAGNVEDAVERVTAQLGEAWTQENDADAGEETMRLRRQAREVDTVRRYLARTLERAREVRRCSRSPPFPPSPSPSPSSLIFFPLSSPLTSPSSR